MCGTSLSRDCCVAACMKPTTPSTKKVRPTIWDPGFPEATLLRRRVDPSAGSRGVCSEPSTDMTNIFFEEDNGTKSRTALV